ncbi:MAG: FecR family protein [Pollutimonas bauzanensis]
MSPSLMLHRSLLAFMAGALLALASTPAPAQPSGARGGNFLYRAMPGDTLIELAQRFTDNPANWSTLQSLNSVQDPTRLSIGRELKIPFSLIPELPSQAQVSHIAGEVGADGESTGIKAVLAEGDSLRTGPDGFVTLVLADRSVISVPAGSSLRIERLRVFKGTGLIDAIFDIRDGSLESSVAPQDTGVGRFEIRTPVSITGVRGTRLRVRASADGSQSEVLSGSAQLSAGPDGEAVVRQDQGAAVDAQGKLLGVRALLPAPRLAPAVRAGQGWTLSFAPVPGAASYLVRVAANQAGTELLSSRQFGSPEISFSAPGPGTYYAVVRAIDSDGVMGKDAVQPFLGQSLLKTSDGSGIHSGYGQFVLLTDY